MIDMITVSFTPDQVLALAAHLSNAPDRLNARQRVALKRAIQAVDSAAVDFIHSGTVARRTIANAGDVPIARVLPGRPMRDYSQDEHEGPAVPPVNPIAGARLVGASFTHPDKGLGRVTIVAESTVYREPGEVLQSTIGAAMRQQAESVRGHVDPPLITDTCGEDLHELCRDRHCECRCHRAE